MRAATAILGFGGSYFFLEGNASAQSEPPPASAAFPPGPGEPAPAASTPRPLPTPPQPGAAPAPSPAGSPPSTPPGPAYPEPQPYARADSGEPAGYVPPPPQNPDDGFQRPDISVRIDPFNFLLEGRLGLELETQLYKWLTLEIVPVFVTTKSPPTLNYNSYEKAALRQASNGIGALSGAAIDAGFWFGGKPFNGYVLRTGFTNYAYTYETEVSGMKVDSVSHTDRQFFAMIGSHNRWGAFTIAGGFGLAYELNKQNRCFGADSVTAQSSCDKDQLLIKLNQSGTQTYNLQNFLYPFDILVRFSLGVVF